MKTHEIIVYRTLHGGDWDPVQGQHCHQRLDTMLCDGNMNNFYNSKAYSDSEHNL